MYLNRRTPIRLVWDIHPGRASDCLRDTSFFVVDPNPDEEPFFLGAPIQVGRKLAELARGNRGSTIILRMWAVHPFRALDLADLFRGIYGDLERR